MCVIVRIARIGVITVWGAFVRSDPRATYAVDTDGG